MNNSGHNGTGFKLPILKLVNMIYRRVFQEDMSSEVLLFLKNLFYVVGSSLITTLVLTIFNIGGGRILGPEEYGKFTLIQSIAAMLGIPMALGFNMGMIKYTSENQDTERQTTIISITNIIVPLLTVFFAIIFILFTSKFSVLFNISKNLFYISIVFAVMSVFYTTTTSVVRGLNENRLFARFQLIFAAIIFVLFIVLVFNRFVSFISMIYSLLFAYGICGILVIITRIHKYIKWQLQRPWINILVKYGLFVGINTISYALYINIGRIMISKYMSIVDVGVYSAYYASSIGVFTLILTMFNLVYLPTISKYESKRILFRRIYKLTPFLFGLGMPLSILCGFIILKIYGSKYPINFLLILLFAIASILIMLYGLLDETFASQGIKGAKLDVIGNVSIAMSSIGLNIYFVPRLGLYGAAISISLSFLVGIICLSAFIRKIP